MGVNTDTDSHLFYSTSSFDSGSPRRPDGAVFFSEAQPTIAPHTGYRMYFEGPCDPHSLPERFPSDAEAAAFPSIMFAAGWAHAEQALRNLTLDNDRRTDILRQSR